MNPQQPVPIPDPKQTMDFLQQGGAFALLCVLLCVGLVFGFFGGRALFRLLREFLGKQFGQLEAQTKLLGEIHAEQKSARHSAQATAASVAAWGTPEWLREKLATLERQQSDLKTQIAAVHVDIAKALARQAPAGAAST